MRKLLSGHSFWNTHYSFVLIENVTLFGFLGTVFALLVALFGPELVQKPEHLSTSGQDDGRRSGKKQTYFTNRILELNVEINRLQLRGF
jgi:hypothetical protein